jgi:hypothetical protein
LLGVELVGREGLDLTTGRPSLYTPELADTICERLAMGESLRTVCKAEDMPSAATVFSWLRTKDDFLEQYEMAKQEAADALADEVLDIADDGTNDYMERLDKNGEPTGAWQLNGEHVQRSRLRIDTRKFLMAKMKPKKYGDRVDHNHTGNIGLYQSMSDDELHEELERLRDSQGE